MRRILLVIVAIALGTSCSTEPPKPTSIAADTVRFASLNQTLQLAPRVLDQHGRPMTGTFTFTYAAASLVASVSTSGVVTSKTNGTADIVISSSGLPDGHTTALVQQVAASAAAVNDSQIGGVGIALANPIKVHVADAGGSAVAGIMVRFTAQDGVVTPDSAATDGQGNAVAGWVLGATPGVGHVQASLSAVAAASPIRFTATAYPLSDIRYAYPAAGTAQQTTPAQTLTNIRPAIRVLDGANHPVAGVSVTFAPDLDGAVSGATVVTDTNGIAQVGGWTVGSQGNVVNHLVAAVQGVAVVHDTIRFAALASLSTFGITLQFRNASSAVQAAFNAAAAAWAKVIFVQLPAIQNFSLPAGTCSPYQTAFSSASISNPVIFASIEYIDGPGGILGAAGPCIIRTGPDYRPLVGVMRFDTADVANMLANGTFTAVVEHEMGHVLGFGSLWGDSYFACLGNPASAGSSPDTFYSCAHGREAFDSIGGTRYTGGAKVPVENCAGISGCGAGTYNSHWRELVFGNELMTGYLNAGANPMSLLTIAAMEDMGYTVSYAAAEPYSRTFAAPGMMATRVELGDDILRLPIREVDSHGRVVRVRRP